MNTLRPISAAILLALAGSTFVVIGCHTRERVVVRSPPPAQVVVTPAPPPPVVQERVIVR